MKFFVVSDIHGQYDKLLSALNEVNYQSADNSHKLIVCGDMFDRGEQNLEVYQFLKSLQDKVIVLKGNHELFFELILDGRIKGQSVFENLKYNGFMKTISAFTGLDLDLIFPNVDKLLDIINDRHKGLFDWILNMPYYFETQNYVFTHAGIDYQVEDWRMGNWYKQVWNNLGIYQDINLRNYGFNKKLVMGHWYTSRLTNNDNDDIYFHRDQQKIFIDGGAAKGAKGKINVLVVEDELIDKK